MQANVSSSFSGLVLLLVGLNSVMLAGGCHVLKLSCDTAGFGGSISGTGAGGEVDGF